MGFVCDHDKIDYPILNETIFFQKTHVTATTEWQGQKTFIKAIKTGNLTSKECE